MADDLPPPIVPPSPPWTPTAAPPTVVAPPVPGAAAGGSSPWWRRPVVVGLAVAVLAAAAAAGVWLGASGSGSSDAAAAKSLERGAVRAARSVGSFHYVSSSNVGGQTQVTVGDAGADAGRQVITLSGHTFTVLVVGSTAYFQGDAVSMIENLQVPPSIAQAHAGQWVSLQPGDGPYQSVYAAVTASSALDDNLTFSPTSRTGDSTIGGQPVVGVRGAIHGLQGQQAQGTGTLYVSKEGRHLPVRYSESGKVGTGTNVAPYSFRIDFSAWGEPVTVTAPANGVPFSSFGLGAGTGGTTGPTVLA